MIKEVLLVFKTHLDIGFTDYAGSVTEKYLSEYLPNAVKIARAQENTDNKFVWTTGSWLISEALKQDDGTLEAAIKDGLICGSPMMQNSDLSSNRGSNGKCCVSEVTL